MGKKKKERPHIVCVLDIWNGMQELSFLFHKIYQIISIHSSFSDCTQQAHCTETAAIRNCGEQVWNLHVCRHRACDVTRNGAMHQWILGTSLCQCFHWDN